MIAQLAIFGVGLYIGIQFVKFLNADADLRLLSRGRHAQDAFDGKIVWITGASRGLGQALAKYFSNQGAKLILSARRREMLEVS